ncbi:MAG: alcohol acetyltransferase [Clostridia bacterium]|nr:alcohol acetyltransferase [Clostridia bacterium]
MAQKFWFKLDNAAKLYPAIANRSWMSMFRLTAELEENVDPQVLQSALDDTIRRFPTMNVRLRAGLFWYYLEEVPARLLVRPDEGHPCMPFSSKRDGSFLFRVFYFGKRISTEFFHVLTDASGGLAFLKTLTVRYLQLMGHDVSFDQGALDITTPPTEEETQDAFRSIDLPKVRINRSVEKTYHIPSTPEIPHTLHIIAASIPCDALLQKAHEMNVTLTEYLTALILHSAYLCQQQDLKKHRFPLRVSVPVNLRSLYGIGTMRNFSSFVNPFIDPRLGEYTFEEICRCVHNYMAWHCTKKQLSAAIATNVSDEKYLVIRLAPLFLKNLVISSVFRRSGDLHFTSTLSNIGRTGIPAGAEKLIRRFEFLLGVPYAPVCNCACISSGNELRLTFSRNIHETALPRTLLSTLVEMGIPVTVDSNDQEDS